MLWKAIKVLMFLSCVRATATINGTATLLPNTFSVQWQLNTATNDLQLTFTGQGQVGGVDQWYAMGFNTEMAMSGTQLIMCGPQTCSPMLATTGYSAPSPSNPGSVVGVSIRDSGAQRVWTFTRLANLSTFQITNASVWTIFATGTWSNGAPQAHAHDPTGRGGIQINYYQPPTPAPTTPAPTNTPTPTSPTMSPTTSSPTASPTSGFRNVTLLPSFGLIWKYDTNNGNIFFSYCCLGLNRYCAMGFNSQPQMAGTDMVVCGGSTCYASKVSGYNTPDPSTVSASITNVSFSDSGSIRTWSFIRIAANSSFAINNSMIWTIFAVGQMSGNTPLQHGSTGNDRNYKQINFVTGEMNSGSAAYYIYYAIGVLGAFCVALLVTFFVSVNNTVSNQLICIGSFLVVVLSWIVLNAMDFTTQQVQVPWFRGVGMAACMVFSVQIVPSLRFITPFAFERSIVYHAMFGFVLYLLITIHMIGMWANYGTDYVFASLPMYSGFIAWIFLTVAILIASLIRRKNYEYFQFTHVLFVFLSITFAITHYPTLWQGIVASFGLYVLDLCARYFFCKRCIIK
eukprot:PhF_6_TR10867/c1_g1_i7/m.17614